MSERQSLESSVREKENELKMMAEKLANLNNELHDVDFVNAAL